jgi:hypothetical protein
MVPVSASSKVWRVEQPVRRLAVFVALFFVLMAAFLTAIDAVPVGAAIFWILAVGVMFCTWRWYLVPYVALRSGHLEVQGAFSLRSVGYDAIRSVTPGPMGLQVETAKEGSIVIWAIQKSKVSQWLHRDTRADRVAAEIMARVESASA